jgi:hypothetical protein
MSEEENIEQSPEEGKTESQQEVNSEPLMVNEEIQSETSNQKSEIENMEVHHHPDLHHKPKPWKEYFLEFLMIFLAVTMGFFAESLRESMTDKEKEKEYISSLINNLEQDTTNLNSAIRDNEKKSKGLDSLIFLSFKNIAEQTNRQQLYIYASKYVSFYSVFISDDATMLQLKNAGGLRLIKHSHVADSIAQYDLEMRNIYAAETPYIKAGSNAVDAVQELLISTWLEDTAYIKNDAFTNKELPLLTNDPQKIRIFFNKISYERGWTRNYITNLEQALPYTIRLTAFLKKEYGLDEK